MAVFPGKLLTYWESVVADKNVLRGVCLATCCKVIWNEVLVGLIRLVHAFPALHPWRIHLILKVPNLWRSEEEIR